MKYIELINIGFERHNMSCQINMDNLGFDDFYLSLKVSKEISFEWSWENPKIVKMVRYKKHDVQNYVEITDLKTLKDLIYLFKEKDGNSGIKPKIGNDNSAKKFTQVLA